MVRKFCLVLIAILNLSCSDKIGSDERFILNQNREYSNSELKKTILNNETFSEQRLNYPPKPINDAKNAVDIAEDILFNTYGEKNIKRQRPYNLVFQDSYWIINGTKKKAEIGGVFLIILNSKNGKIIKITHGE